ncbi:MAG: MBL fold metallo-hydrolase [Eubacterium sp.]
MKFCSLYSGSSGNSLFVSQCETKLLIDAGLSGKRIEQALVSIDELPGEIRGILVTHEHKDHIHGVGVLSRRYNLPIYANEGTWKRMEESLGRIKEHNRFIFETDRPFCIGDLEIEAFSTSHDAAASVGFTINNGSASIGIATDTGMITPRIVEALENRDLVVLESNHDPSMLDAGWYPFPLKQRIKSDYGHLSNAICAKTVETLVRGGVDKVVLAHLSQENNYPLLAYQTTECVLKEAGIIAGEDLSLAVAKRSSSSDIYEL